MIFSPGITSLSIAASASPRAWHNNSSERVGVGLSGADAQRMVDRRDKDLAVADLPRPRARGDDLDRLVGELGGDGDFDPQFGQKIHDIFGAAIDLGVALLAAVPLDLGHGHAVD